MTAPAPCPLCRVTDDEADPDTVYQRLFAAGVERGGQICAAGHEDRRAIRARGRAEGVLLALGAVLGLTMMARWGRR